MGVQEVRWDKGGQGKSSNLQEVGGGGDWMELAQDRDRWWALVNTVMNLGSIKCREFLD